MRLGANLCSIACFAGALAALPQAGAQARIICDGNYQIVQGQPISTPYCRDQNLAVVARRYGIRVSAERIRHSESAKAEVCRFIGNDIRVKEVCQPYLPDGGRLRRF